MAITHAALLAADKYHPACADMRIAELVVEAERIAREAPGGPDDRALRMALAARRAALGMIGREGSCLIQHNLDGAERRLPEEAVRPESVLPIHAWDFELLLAVASCRPEPAVAAAA